MPGGAAATEAPPINDLKTRLERPKERTQTKAPGKRGDTETQHAMPLRAARPDVLCTMYYVLCTVYDVLCTVYCVLWYM